jgi:hypothetical protein
MNNPLGMEVGCGGEQLEYKGLHIKRHSVLSFTALLGLVVVNIVGAKKAPAIVNCEHTFTCGAGNPLDFGTLDLLVCAAGVRHVLVSGCGRTEMLSRKRFRSAVTYSNTSHKQLVRGS